MNKPSSNLRRYVVFVTLAALMGCATVDDTENGDDSPEVGLLLLEGLAAFATGWMIAEAASGTASRNNTAQALSSLTQIQSSPTFPGTTTQSPSSYGQNSFSDAKAQAQNQSSGGQQTYRSAARCVGRDQKSNSQTDFLVNNCDFTLTVRWIDQGNCSRGCSQYPLYPGKRASVSKARGKIETVACEYPGIPRSPSGSDWARGSYICR